MVFYSSEFFGVHVCRGFWGMTWLSLFQFCTPVPRRRLRDLNEQPMDTLKRGLAKSEINGQEHARLKTPLESVNPAPYALFKLGT